MEIAGSLIGGLFASDAAENAADTQAQSERESLALKKQMYEQQRIDAAPFRELSISALDPLKALAGLSSTQTPQQVMMQDPGYQWRFDEGNRGIQSSALSKGLLQSGRTAKDLLKYSQGLASQEYGNTFNRLSGLAGIGQSAVNSGNAYGANYANAAGDSMTGAANARASGYIGSGNAINSAIGQGINSYNQNEWMKRLPPAQNDSSWNPSNFYQFANNYTPENYG